MHQPDTNGRMMLVAARDIAAKEEFTISYFDLAKHKYLDVKGRRAYPEDEFRFTCLCSRYLKESGESSASQMTDMWPGLISHLTGMKGAPFF